MQHLLKPAISLLLGSALTAIIFTVDLSSPHPSPIVFAQETLTNTSVPLATPRLQYQGQLLDPTTGKPVANGAYAMIFRLYNAAAGGSVLWTETQSISTVDGLFSTLLAVDPNVFSGQDLYLGVQIGSDPEAAPRQPVAYVGYAFRADRATVADTTTTAQNATNADQLDGIDSGGFVRFGNNGVVAYGVVESDGSRITGPNFSSSRDDTGAYRISISGEDYTLNKFVTMVTPVVNSECPEAVLVGTGSGGGQLLVDLFDRSGNRRSCKFHFVTFEP